MAPENGHHFQHVSCNLCGSRQSRLRFKGTLPKRPPTVDEYVGTNPGYRKYHDIVQCGQCGLTYMNPRDRSVPELCSKVVDQDYLASWSERKSTFDHHLNLIRRHKPRGTLLDVGCYAGIFLESAKDAGFEVEGLEASSWAAEHAARALGIPVTRNSLEEASLPRERFDVITLWDVIEHVEDPLGGLRKIADALKPDGLLAISTHDIESRFARLLGPHYPWLMRFHLYHFSPETLTAMVKKAGLSPFAVTSYVKKLPLGYFMKRIGIHALPARLSQLRFSVNTGDFFILLARKPG